MCPANHPARINGTWPRPTVGAAAPGGPNPGNNNP